MPTLKTLAKALVSDPLRTLVRTRRANDYHESLRKNHAVMLDQALLEATQLVKDRAEMLRRMPKNGRVAEVGVARGDFSRQILDICQPKQLHLIDPWCDESVADYSAQSHRNILARFKDEIAAGQVFVHRGLSAQVLPTFADDDLDWIYIDAAHDYGSVADELKISARVVKGGGLIAGHDYIRWVSPTERYGVMEAVNEFAMATRSPFAFLTNQFDKHESFALTLHKPG